MLRVAAKLRGQYPDFVETFRVRRLFSKLIKNGTIVHCIPKDKLGVEFELPVEVIQSGIPATFCVVCDEYTGNVNTDSFSNIVCGINGEKLKPYYITTETNQNARFCVPNTCVNIGAFAEQKSIQIRIYRIEVFPDKIRLLSQLVFSGNITNLPKEFDCFKEAADVALIKAQNPDLKAPYYYDGSSLELPEKV